MSTERSPEFFGRGSAVQFNQRPDRDFSTDGDDSADDDPDNPLPNVASVCPLSSLPQSAGRVGFSQENGHYVGPDEAFQSQARAGDICLTPSKNEGGSEPTPSTDPVVHGEITLFDRGDNR